MTHDSPELMTSDRIAATAPFDPSVFYRTFRAAKTQVDGVTLHYVTGGSGPVILLLHGWPATWSYWRRVMPALAASHTIISVDMPGFGSSTPAPSADKVRVSALLHKLMVQLGHARVSIVSHDMGGPVAYAYAAQFPEDVDKVVFTETAIPGFGFADGSDHDLLKIGPESVGGIWHFAAFMKPGMVEMLVRGHERQFIDAMVTESYTNPAAFSEDEAQELTRWISSPGGFTGGLAYYRSLFRDADDNRRLAATKLAMPVSVLNGEDGFLRYAAPASVRAVAENVREDLVPPWSDPEGGSFARVLGVHPDASIRVAMLRLGPGTTLEVTEFTTPDQRRVMPALSDWGAAHIALRVADIDVAAEALRARGLEVLEGPMRNGPGPIEGSSYLYFRTPWGMPLELEARDGRHPYEGPDRHPHPAAPNWEWRPPGEIGTEVVRVETAVASVGVGIGAVIADLTAAAKTLPGTLDYWWRASEADPARFLSYQRFRDRAAADAVDALGLRRELIRGATLTSDVLIHDQRQR